MHFNLKMLNLLIGMSKGDRQLPSILFDAGFEVHSIERRFANTNLEMVHPEIILSSGKLGHSLLIESKAGANVDIAQAKRYADVTSDDLRSKAFLKNNSWTNHDVVYLCNADSSRRLTEALRVNQMSFPVIQYDGKHLDLVDGKISCEQLDQEFRSGVKVLEDLIPTGYIPIDGDSAQHEIASVVIGAIVAEMVKRVPRLTIDQVCAGTCPWWGVLAKPGREKYKGAIRSIGERLAGQVLSTWITWDKKGNAFDIKQNPWIASGQRQSAERRRLQSQVEKFIVELNPDADVTVGKQMLLFPEDED